MTLFLKTHVLKERINIVNVTIAIEVERILLEAPPSPYITKKDGWYDNAERNSSKEVSPTFNL